MFAHKKLEPEKELRARLAAIVESSNDAIISKDLDAVITTWNAAAQRIFGYREEEVVGQPITILIPPELLGEENQILARLRAGERVENYETIRVTKAGKNVNVSLTISPIKDSTGKVVGFSKIARDITQRKQAEEALRASEERFHLAALAGKMFAYEWDAATDVIVRSAEFAQVLGDEPVETTGQQVMARIHPDDRETVKAALAALTPENPHLRISYRMARRDGAFIWVERTSRAHFDEQGRILRLIGMVADAEERKQAEEALKESEQRLRLAQQAAHIGTFEWNIQTGVNTWTPELEVMYGLPPGSFGGTQPAFENLVHPDDRAGVIELNNWALKSGEPTGGEWGWCGLTGVFIGSLDAGRCL